jgi:signal transduction histidine kinase
LQAETRERRELEKRILDISEREQARIGQDLHDGLCQHLVSTAFSANSLHQQLAGRAPMEADKAAEISELLDESITQARLLARGLYPVRLEEEGLATALQELAENVQSRFNVRCALFSTGQGQAPDQSVAIHLYRLAQEAINNAIKHGRPRTVRLDLRQEGTTCELSVTDDGQGISRGERRSDGMGLRIMEYRARMIGGTFEVQPGPEGGTIVRCVAKTS